MLDIEVPEEFVERGITNMREEVARMKNIEEEFEEQNLEHTEAYKKLQAEREDLEAGIEEIVRELNRAN